MSEWCGDGEPVTVYNERRVRARKPHQCSACKEAIRPGHYYMRIGIVFDGSAEALKRCLRCQALHAHLREKCAASEDEMWPADRLDCGLTYESEWGDLPPEIAALAFQTGASMQPDEAACAR